MEILLNYVVPVVIIVILAAIYVLWLTGRNKTESAAAADDTKSSDEWKQAVPKNARVVPYMETKILRFYEMLKMALPAGFTIIPHCPIEKLFEFSKRKDLQMLGQYGDFVIFNDNYLPVLVIDLFDMSIVSLDTVNKIKGIFKDVLRNSGIPVMDFKMDSDYNIDMLRREIADTINPLNKIRK
jgi:hypothetical protein